MQEIYLWSVIRYVELNLVRAGLVSAAEEFRWSSAAAHWSGKDISHLLELQFGSASDSAKHWEEFLSRAPLDIPEQSPA